MSQESFIRNNIELQKKIGRHQPITKEDYMVFDKKRSCRDEELAKKVEIAPTNIVIVVDSSGSMHGKPFKDAMKIATILYEAARDFKEVSLYVYAMGNDSEPPLRIAHPDMRTEEIGKNIDAAEKDGGRNDYDHLIPSVVMALSDISQKISSRPTEIGSRTHIFSITDGGNCDYGRGRYRVNDVLEKMIRENPQITFDSLFLCDKDRYENYTKPLINDLKKEGITQMDYVDIYSSEVISEKIIEMLKKRMSYSEKDSRGKIIKRINREDNEGMARIIKDLQGDVCL